MEKLDLKKELELAKFLSVKAAKVILEVYNTDFNVEFKDDKSPLTLADKKANDIIVTALKNEFPDYAILAEESEDDLDRLNNDWCWIVDPLDGTKEFLKRNDEFTVNIALSYKNKTVLGVVNVPVTGEIYYAYKGSGAFYEKDGNVKQINTTEKTENIILMKSRSHASDKLLELLEKYKDKIAKTIDAGSSLKGCLIALGEADVYYRFGLTMEWDTAAMQCVVEEAGGTFMQLDDTDMTYNRKNSLNEKGFYILNNPENKMH